MAGKYNRTVQDLAIKLAMTNCPKLCKIPPVALTPIKLTRFGPNCLTSNIPNKLNAAPALLYNKVEKVPPNKAVNNVLSSTTNTTSCKDNVYKPMTVIILATPNLAPGANAKGKGIACSSKLRIIP